jgi:hypothetical protein
MFFYIKKPSFLNFSKHEYEYEQIKKFTITQRKGATNTKLIVYEDNSMYLKNGSKYFKLSESPINKINYVGKIDDKNIAIEQPIDKKYFIHKL